MKRYIITLIILLIIHSNNVAQTTTELGIIPSLNINKRLPKDWSLNFKAESRQSLIKEGFDYNYLLTDISFAASKKIGINTSAAMGFLIRIDNDGVKNRTLQQITFISRFRNFRLSHRLLTDQTFTKDDYTELRLRYRISAEIPLQGESPDPKEFYLKVNNEYLNSLYNSNYDLEIRGAALLGYMLSPNNLFEFGFDYRIDSFINGNPRNRLWINLNFYTSI